MTASTAATPSPTEISSTGESSWRFPNRLQSVHLFSLGKERHGSAGVSTTGSIITTCTGRTRNITRSNIIYWESQDKTVKYKSRWGEVVVHYIRQLISVFFFLQALKSSIKDDMYSPSPFRFPTGAYSPSFLRLCFMLWCFLFVCLFFNSFLIVVFDRKLPSTIKSCIGKVVHKLKAELKQSMKMTKKAKIHFTFVSKPDMDIPGLMVRKIRHFPIQSFIDLCCC